MLEIFERCCTTEVSKVRKALYLDTAMAGRHPAAGRTTAAV